MKKPLIRIFATAGCIWLAMSYWPQTTIAQIQLDDAFPNLTFTGPIGLENAGDQSNRLFVIEQAGIIRVFENNPQVMASTTFLDIRSRVDSRGGEQGLLGLAFHPEFPDSNYFYVNYTAAASGDKPNRTVISRFMMSESDSNTANDNSEYIILEYEQPVGNHNGGKLAFGPDSLLYIAVGDGGGGGDPDENGQNKSTLLGSILRIDVDSRENGERYGIPPDNPFAENDIGAREEIFAYGFRNPWRFSFDSVTGWLWCGDVGQSMVEEIDIVENGGNYGWDIMEGSTCYNSSNCDTTGLRLPVYEYTHESNGGHSSITGGFVYRGTRAPSLVGKYIYADYISGRIWQLTYDGNAPAQNDSLIFTNRNISSFGVAENQELFVVDYAGKVLQFTGTSTDIESATELPAGYTLHPNYPNPFSADGRGTFGHPETRIDFELAQPGSVRLVVTDMLGRKVRTLIDAQVSAGEHQLRWRGINDRGESVSSGVYFLRMEAGDFVAVRKMLLVR